VAHARWEHFPHQADIGIRGIGATRAQAFEQAAVAMTAAITDPELVVPAREIRIECEAPDDELLLVDWLNSLVYEMAIRQMLFGQFSVSLEGLHLHAKAKGEPLDAARHHPAVEVKGATFTELEVKADSQGLWHAQCVIDV